MTWVLAIIIGLLTSIMYVSQYYGISVFIMTLLYVGTMYIYKKQAGVAVGRQFYLISGYMVLLSPIFAVTTIGVIRFWSGLVLVVLLLVLAICELEFRWPKWLKSSLGAFIGSIARMIQFFTYGKSMPSESRRQIAYVLIGLIIALPILLVAGALLASADAVMADLMEQVFESIQMHDVGIWVGRALVFMVLTPIIFGYSRWFVEHQLSESEAVVNKQASVEVIPATVSGTILLLLNILYCVFAYVQIRFLFFGSGLVTPGVYDYAHYARSGFFELVTLSILNTIGILVINKFTKVHLFNEISLTITALCSFIMMASSWYKMHIYEQAYGYTQLRLYVYVILGFMVVFMALITIGIWKKNYRVIEWSIVIGLTYFLVISYVNVDKIIVENNVARYVEEGQLDFYHLTYELSEDAVPYVIEAVESGVVNIAEMDGVGQYDHLVYKVQSNDEARQFFEFNWRHDQALKAIKGLDGLE